MEGGLYSTILYPGTRDCVLSCPCILPAIKLALGLRLIDFSLPPVEFICFITKSRGPRGTPPYERSSTLCTPALSRTTLTALLRSIIVRGIKYAPPEPVSLCLCPNLDGLCAIPILRRDVRAAATAATAALWRITMGNTRRQQCALSIYLLRCWSHYLTYRHVAASCSEYLCPATLACVTRPEECPCPHVQDVKCVVPDDQDRDHGTVLCVRGGSDCAAVEQLGKKFTK